MIRYPVNPEDKEIIQYLVRTVLPQTDTITLAIDGQWQEVEVYRTIDPWTGEFEYHLKFKWMRAVKYRSRSFEITGPLERMEKLLLNWETPAVFEQYREMDTIEPVGKHTTRTKITVKRKEIR